MSALAVGDCIDDANALRAGGTEGIVGSGSRRPRPWPHSCGASAGPLRQLDGSAGIIPRAGVGGGRRTGSAVFMIDLDSTICETYRLEKDAAGTTSTPMSTAMTHSWDRRRARDVLMTRARRGPGEYRPWCRALPARDDRPGPRGGCQRPGDGRGRQRLLSPCTRRGRPGDGRLLQHHDPPEERHDAPC